MNSKLKRNHYTQNGKAVNTPTNHDKDAEERDLKKSNPKTINSAHLYWIWKNKNVKKSKSNQIKLPKSNISNLLLVSKHKAKAISFKIVWPQPTQQEKVQFNKKEKKKLD